MAAGVTNKIWEHIDIIAVPGSYTQKAEKRDSHKEKFKLIHYEIRVAYERGSAVDRSAKKKEVSVYDTS